MLDIHFLLSHLTFQLCLNHAEHRPSRSITFCRWYRTNDRDLPSFSFSWKFPEQQEKTFMIIAQNDRPQGLETMWGLLKCLVFQWFSPVFGHFDVYSKRNFPQISANSILLYNWKSYKIVFFFISSDVPFMIFASANQKM